MSMPLSPTHKRGGVEGIHAEEFFVLLDNFYVWMRLQDCKKVSVIVIFERVLLPKESEEAVGAPLEDRFDETDVPLFSFYGDDAFDCVFYRWEVVEDIAGKDEDGVIFPEGKSKVGICQVYLFECYT